MAIVYTGVGSRQTPAPLIAMMRRVGAELADVGYVLRSGGADGADTAFEAGCKEREGRREIYLPWKGFNGRADPACIYDIPDKAMLMAEEIHPAWYNCSPAARKLHARNVCQVLGKTLDAPSWFLICWTIGGAQGGTRTAISVAYAYDVPVLNLSLPDAPADFKGVMDWVEKAVASRNG